MSYKFCCDDFQAATADGTDNEAWAALILVEEDGKWHIGADLPAIKHCPWCGVLVRDPPPQANPEGQAK